jgi:FkbM family methyltransferase
LFKHQGIWLPDGEKHFPEWMDRNGEIVDGLGTYQIKKLRAALAHCTRFRTAVDVGAHVGLWSMHLARRFVTLHAFEPVAEFRACWRENMQGRGDVPDVLLYPMALGAKPCWVKMNVNPADTGGTHVGEVSAEGSIEMHRLDDFDLQDVDFVKIDCEGYELEVLKGAVKTLDRCKPCVIVEQKQHKLGPNFGIKGTPAVDLLRDMGAKMRAEMSGDFVMAWD